MKPRLLRLLLIRVWVDYNERDYQALGDITLFVPARSRRTVLYEVGKRCKSNILFVLKAIDDLHGFVLSLQ